MAATARLRVSCSILGSTLLRRGRCSSSRNNNPAAPMMRGATIHDGSGLDLTGSVGIVLPKSALKQNSPGLKAETWVFRLNYVAIGAVLPVLERYMKPNDENGKL